VTDAPYPRADPAGAEYLPIDVWAAARLPVGVRLELVGNAKTIRVWYETSRASLGYRGESAGCAFVAYRAGQRVAMVDALMGEGMAELLMSGRPDLPVTVYLPEGMAPLVTGVAGVEDTMVPAPLQPRWLAYGDAVTQGWLASAPAMAWPAVAGRKLGLDVCNLGYAGTARGETTSALMLAEIPAEVVSIAFGLNNWSRVPHTKTLMAEEVRCFLSVVRKGHPETPIVVVSPTVRPDAENEPNRVGATLAELRTAMEQTVRTCIDEGDERLFLVEGLAVVDPDDLEDGIYPGDEGHRRLAAAVSKILAPRLADLQMAAEKRWAAEGVSPIPVPIPTPTPVPSVSSVSAVPAASSVPAVEIPGVEIPGVPLGSTFDSTFDTASMDGLGFSFGDEMPDFDLPEFSLRNGNGSFPATDAPEAVAGSVLNGAGADAVLNGAGADAVLNGAGADAVLNGSAPETTLPEMSSHDDYSPDEFFFDGASLTDTSLNGSLPGTAFPDFEADYADTAYGQADYAQADYAQADYPDTNYPETGYFETDGAQTASFETDEAETDYSELGYFAAGYAEAVYDEAQYSEGSTEVGASGDVALLDVAPATSSAERVRPEGTPPKASPDTSLSEISVNGSSARATFGVASEDDAVASTGGLSNEGPSTNGTSRTGGSPVEGDFSGGVSTGGVSTGGVSTGGQASVNGEAADEQSTSELKRPVRRESAPVDIAVADMVVAALTLATNGADDVIYGREQLTEDDLHWVDASDPSPY
jgi:lysophospholipase L1-like esterase